MKIYENVSALIGNTPLMKLGAFSAFCGLKTPVYAKLEMFNPAGSVKDRIALGMIEDAERRGEIKKGATLIEPTSGNTGIGLAAIGASKGYKVVLTMPDTMSKERQKLIKAYGAEIILTDGKDGMNGAVKKAEELRGAIPGSMIMGQFYNRANPQTHYDTTAREIYDDSGKRIEVFVAGIGSGGTISGIGRYLKEQNPEIETVGVEPYSSPLISKGYSGKHGLQGIGANFVPENYDSRYVDKIMTVKDEDAFNAARMLAKTEGILAGITSGASLSAAVALAKKAEYENRFIVALLPDTGTRYLSADLF